VSLDLPENIERVSALPDEGLGDDALALFERLLIALEAGEVRAAEKGPSGDWVANAWVKKGILLGFRLGQVTEMEPAGPLRFFDKDTLPPLSLRLEAAVRVVPGGSAIRRGVHVGRGVVMMPPAYINVGAFVDEGTLVDSHALVGSCAQVGKRVHLSAGAMLGGVLEPVGALPVIVEDEAFIGGNCGVYEGTIVGSRAVLAAGVILTGGVSVHDIPREAVYRRTAQTPLKIPEGAVVVPGSRRLSGSFAEKSGLSLSTPVIVKYRDEKTSAATALEESLR
jgi:2,3,4,5-tetrahydropyridine-2-carboxylate N-succinyltransferase